MRTVFTIIIAFSFCFLKAQTINNNHFSIDSNKRFKNQGEQENYWAERLFENDYSEQVYKRYKGEISLSGDSIRYLNQVLIVFGISSETKEIFLKGILYPAVLNIQSNSRFIKNIKSDTLTQEQNNTLDINQEDSLRISNLSELTFLSQLPTKRRFRFWLYHRHMLNPTVYYFELTNKKATNKTDIKTFIDGATLTFIREDGIII